MQKIRVSTSSVGTANPANIIYTISMGPQDITYPNYADVNSVETLHGAPAYQSSIWDGRMRTIIWNNWPAVSTGYGFSIQTQLSTIKSWVGQIRYFNFGDLTRLMDYPSANNWKKFRIINVETKVKPKSNLIYDSITMQIQPEI